MRRSQHDPPALLLRLDETGLDQFSNVTAVPSPFHCSACSTHTPVQMRFARRRGSFRPDPHTVIDCRSTTTHPDATGLPGAALGPFSENRMVTVANPIFTMRTGIPRSPRLTAYSFRHGLVEALRVAGVQDDLRRRLLGHAARDIHGRYGATRPQLVEARDAMLAALEHLGDIDPSVYSEAERLD